MTIKTAFVFIDRQNEYIHQFSPQYSGECLYKWLHCDMMKEQFRRILQSTEERREDHWCFFCGTLTTYVSCCYRKSKGIIKDPNHLSNNSSIP